MLDKLLVKLAFSFKLVLFMLQHRDPLRNIFDLLASGFQGYLSLGVQSLILLKQFPEPLNYVLQKIWFELGKAIHTVAQGF